MHVCWLCVHRCICLWDITCELCMEIILQHVSLRGHSQTFQYRGTALTSRGSFLRWELCLHSQGSTAHCSPVYSSFPHPFIPLAPVKSKSTKGRAFGCPKTLSWVGGSAQHQQGRSCVRGGKELWLQQLLWERRNVPWETRSMQSVRAEPGTVLSLG